MPPRPTAIRTLAPQPAPPGLYAPKFDPELAAAICSRVAAGESLRAICWRDPVMPTEKTVWNWRRAHAWFDLALGHVQGLARQRSLAAQAKRDAARRAEREAPGRRRAWNAGRSGFTAPLANAICGRLAMGESLTEICRDPAMPSIGTVYNWLRADPDFVANYRLARRIQAELIERACETPPPPRRGALMVLRRRFKAAERRMGFLKLRRYAPPEGPAEVRIVLENEAGETVLYGGDEAPGRGQRP